MRAGREDRGKYQARAAVKQKKVWLAYVSCLATLVHLIVHFPFLFGWKVEFNGRYSASNNLFYILWALFSIEGSEELNTGSNP